MSGEWLHDQLGSVDESNILSSNRPTGEEKQQTTRERPSSAAR